MVFVLTNIITLVLAIKYGHTQFTKSDVLSGAIAGVAIAAWLLLGARVALVAVALATTTSLAAVLAKLRRHPGSEDVLSWVMVVVAMTFSLGAILLEGNRDPAVLFQPTVMLVGVTAVSLAAIGPERVVGLLRGETKANLPQVSVPATPITSTKDLVLGA